MLDLVGKGLTTDHVSLYVGYRKDEGLAGHRSASRKLSSHTSSFRKLWTIMEELYNETVDASRAIRRVNMAFGGLMPEEHTTRELFADTAAEEAEHDRQEAILAIKKKFGTDAVMKGTSLKEKARGYERAHQVGGHHE